MRSSFYISLGPSPTLVRRFVSSRLVSSSLFALTGSRGDPLHFHARSRQVVGLPAVVELERVLVWRVRDLIGKVNLNLRDSLLVVRESLPVDVRVVAPGA